jgi:hypothetical protein
MKNGLLALSLLASLAIMPPTQAVAEPQQEFAPPPGGQLPGGQLPQGNQALEVAPSQNNRILELPPLVGGALPSPPPAVTNPVIPSPFIGCWEGTVEQWDSAVGNFQNVTISNRVESYFVTGQIISTFRSPSSRRDSMSHRGSKRSPRI